MATVGKEDISKGGGQKHMQGGQELPEFPWLLWQIRPGKVQKGPWMGYMHWFAPGKLHQLNRDLSSIAWPTAPHLP